MNNPNMPNLDVNYIALVQKFHTYFDHPVLPFPEIPANNRCALRYNLLKEEVIEFMRAFDNDDIVEAADALGDIMYVLCGAILEFGLQDKFPAIFAEIHRSNMSKADKTAIDAAQTRDLHTKAGTACTTEERNGMYFCISATGKTLKSINYSPADITGILNS